MTPSATPAESDELTLLQSSTPERIYRFAEKWFETLDAGAAAAHVGSPGAARELVQDRRAQLVFAALAGQTRETAADLRRATLGWICSAMTADPAGLFDDSGMVRMKLADIPAHIRASLQVEVKSDGSWKATLPNKLKIAELLLTLTGDLNVGSGATTSRVIFYGRSS